MKTQKGDKIYFVYKTVLKPNTIVKNVNFMRVFNIDKNHCFFTCFGDDCPFFFD